MWRPVKAKLACVRACARLMKVYALALYAQSAFGRAGDDDVLTSTVKAHGRRC